MNISDFATDHLLNETVETSNLTEREKHLIGLAVTTTRGCIYCTGNRIKQAQEQNVSYSTLLAALDLAAAVNAGVTIATACQGTEHFAMDCGCNENKCV